MASEEAVLYTVKERKKKYHVIDDLLHIKRISAKLLFRNGDIVTAKNKTMNCEDQRLLCDNPAYIWIINNILTNSEHISSLTLHTIICTQPSHTGCYESMKDIIMNDQILTLNTIESSVIAFLQKNFFFFINTCMTYSFL